jgi:hypothetical protein
VDLELVRHSLEADEGVSLAGVEAKVGGVGLVRRDAGGAEPGADGDGVELRDEAERVERAVADVAQEEDVLEVSAAADLAVLGGGGSGWLGRGGYVCEGDGGVVELFFCF